MTVEAKGGRGGAGNSSNPDNASAGGVSSGVSGSLSGGGGNAGSGGGNYPDTVVLVRTQRKYLPTLSDLVDRLTIVQLKAIFITDHREEYLQERALIEHDIDLILQQVNKPMTAADIHAIMIIMLTNRFIWENESKARNGAPDQDKLLKLTHSINGVRNAAKNQLARFDGGRHDYKLDCFAAELVKDYGNWNVF